ncbi:MAG: SpoVG family protein [bacterium]
MSDTPWGSPKKTSGGDTGEGSENTAKKESSQPSESATSSSPWGASSASSSSDSASFTPSAGSNDQPASFFTGDKVITEVSVKPYQSGSLRAFVDMKLFGHFVVKGLKVMDGKNGLWVAMPSNKESSGDWVDKFHPITKKGREKIFDLVLKAYKKKQDGQLPNGTEQEPVNLGTPPEYETDPAALKAAAPPPSAGGQELPFWKRMILKLLGVDLTSTSAAPGGSQSAPQSGGESAGTDDTGHSDTWG